MSHCIVLFVALIKIIINKKHLTHNFVSASFNCLNINVNVKVLGPVSERRLSENSE